MSRSDPWPDTSSRRLDVSLVTSTLSMRREHEPHRRLSLTGLQVLHYSDGLGPVDREGLGFASNRSAPPSIVLLNFVVLGRSYDASGFAEATLACGNARALPQFASLMADQAPRPVTAHGRGGNSQFKVGFRRGDIVPVPAGRAPHRSNGVFGRP